MSEKNNIQPSPETMAARAGENEVTHFGRSRSMPLYQTTVFAFDSLEEGNSVNDDPSKGWFYYRYGGPNQSVLELALAELEGAEAACAMGSGMGAIFAALVSAAQSGDHIISDKVIYGGTVSLLAKQLPRFGIETTFVDISKLDEVKAAIKPNTKALFFETLSNPLLGVADIAALSELAHQNGLLALVDSTFTTPALLKPLEFGADVVIHANSKYLGGHGDAMGGILAGKKAFVQQALEAVKLMGMVISPFDAWLNVRSIKTLPLRMAAHSRTALAVAEWLETQPKVSKVFYPGLKSHPQYELAMRQMPRGCSGMLSFELKDGNQELVGKFVSLLDQILFVPSLGDVSTALSYPATTSHKPLTQEQRLALGVTDGLIRLSVGIEDPADIIKEFETAFSLL